MKTLREGSLDLGLLNRQLIWRDRKEEADGEKLQRKLLVIIHMV